MGRWICARGTLCLCGRIGVDYYFEDDWGDLMAKLSATEREICWFLWLVVVLCIGSAGWMGLI